MGNIFIRRPIFAMVIAIMIIVLGLIGIQNTPIEQYPDITPPMVQVSADYQGADALTVEQSIATPIEESVNGVSDMLYMQSTNSNDGSMSLQVTFGVGSNPDMNTIYTQNRVASATPQLPAAVITQGVTTQKTTTSYIMVLSLFSADGRYDETFLSNYAMLNIKDRIARINGVGQVQVLGSGAYAMRVWIKPDKMDYLGLTVADIAGAITSQSEVVPGGQLGAEPTAEKPDFTYTVRMPSPYNTAEQFGNVIVRANPDGSLVRLHDVATIELGTQSYSVSSTYQGHDAVLMIINQSPGSNAVQVGKEVKALLSEMYSNTKMAMENINSVLSKVKGKSMIQELTTQMGTYSAFTQKTSQLMHERSIEPKEPGLMAKTMAKAGISINTMIDNTDSHIADMVAKGCDMGADSLSEAYAKHAVHCDAKVADLCNEIIDYERQVSSKIEGFHR